MDRALQDLIDKQAIREVVLTYCRGIDRLDFQDRQINRRQVTR